MTTAGQQLKNMIYEAYKSESTMAEKMKWPRQKLNKITTDRKIPTVLECSDLAEALDKSIGEIALLFLPQKSPNGQQINQGG